ncbi:MAG TPA: hypothetical protein VF721_14120 [Pyrinomonadaceae bacterium]
MITLRGATSALVTAEFALATARLTPATATFALVTATFTLRGAAFAPATARIALATARIALRGAAFALITATFALATAENFGAGGLGLVLLDLRDFAAKEKAERLEPSAFRFFGFAARV